MAMFDTPEKITAACNKDGYLTGYVELEFEDVVDMTRADLEEKLTRALVGTSELEDLSFKPVAIGEHGLVTFYVNGKAAF